ncbi:MAG: CBS domain-containing protein [Halobacteriaceae archaeon]
MNVAETMTPRSSLVTVSLPGNRDDALRFIQEEEFSSVPVVKETENGEVYRGLVSRGDLIANPEVEQLAILMHEDCPTVDSAAALETVAELVVDEDVRRVPVVDGDSLAGIVTVTDLVEGIASGAVDGGAEVGDLARRDVNTVYAGTPLPVAERELGLAQVPYGVVLDEDCSMCGILTRVDIIDVARVVEGEDDVGDSIADEDDDWMWEGIKAVGNRYFPTRNVELPVEPVESFMTREVVTISERHTTREAARTMRNHDVEQLPLVSGDDLVGIVRDVDLVKNLV